MAMKVKTVLLVALLLVAAVDVAPKAKAQSGFLKFLSLFNIQGTIFCSSNGRINATDNNSTAVFSSAIVQLQCGNGSTVMSSTITNSSGVFSIFLDPITMLLSVLLQNCRVVVTTPLSTCNADLPSVGALVSALRPLGTTVLGLINISNIVPTGFIYTPNA